MIAREGEAICTNNPGSSSMLRRGAGRPDTKDLALSSDGRFLYAVASVGRQVAVFRIGEEGRPVELDGAGSPFTVSRGQAITGLAAD